LINVIQWTMFTLFLLAAIYAAWLAASDQPLDGTAAARIIEG
jgi:hypothetical protein